jgi:hypothetical protein
VADRALARGFDQATNLAVRPFFYLPFMHSEALIDQDRSVRLCEALGEPEQLRHATEHRDVVQRFGAVSPSASFASPARSLGPHSLSLSKIAFQEAITCSKTSSMYSSRTILVPNHKRLIVMSVREH